MLSAAHCAANGQVVKDGGGEVMGVVQGDNNARDTLLINHAPSLSAGRMYTGPWNAGLGMNKKVAGKAASFVGQFVGTSGARSGEHCCLITVTAVNAVVVTAVGPFSPMVLATQLVAGQGAAAKGDSGGPVFSPAAGGKVTAKGTISAGGGTTVNCPGSPFGLFIPCYPKIAYADVSKTISWYDANPAATTISLLTVP